MRKLVFKPIVKKLPDAVKAVRRLKAIFILDNMSRKKHFLFKKAAIDTLNPNHLD